MNQRKKWRRFWTMKVHDHSGFTLVELIIVIAILAILSSVAVVGYSAYIKKANEAADTTALAQLNSAFAAACANNGVDWIGIEPNNAPELDLNENDNKVTGLKVNGQITEAVAADFLASIGSGITFKVMKVERLSYKSENGTFVYMSSGNFSVDWADADAFKNSIFGNTEYMSVRELLMNADDIVSWADDKNLAPVNMEEDPFKSFYEDLLEKAGIDASKLSPEQIEKMKYNALVLYTAQASDRLEVNDELVGYIKGESSFDDEDPAKDVAAAAMKYAVAMAFVREYNKTNGYTQGVDGYIEPTSYEAVMSVFADTIYVYDEAGGMLDYYENPAYGEFQTWFATNGASAIEGYLAAMGMLDSNTESLTQEDAEKFLKEGFSSDDYFSGTIEDLLGQA